MTASHKKPVEVIAPVERPSEYFGKKVFNRAKMYKYLPATVPHWTVPSLMLWLKA